MDHIHKDVDSNNEVYKITWLRNNQVHRDDGPAIIEYSTLLFNGVSTKLMTNCQWCQYGKLHRLDGPASITRIVISDIKDRSLLISLIIEEWYRDGIYNRENGPSYYDYYIDNINHINLIQYKHSAPFLREEMWYHNDTLHREDGPAHIIRNKKGHPRLVKWYIHGVDKSSKVKELMNNGFGIPEDWENWSNDHKMDFQLIFKLVDE